MTNSNLKKTILLTGVTGYLGSNLLNKLAANKNFTLIVLKRSFSNTFRIKQSLQSVTAYNIDIIEMDEVFKRHSIDTIIHCATDYGRKNTPVLQTIETNLLIPIRLLELGKQYGVECFINTDTILDKRVNAYSLSKKQFKEWLYQSKNSLKCVNVALEHFFGPGDDKTKFASFIVDAMLTKVPFIDLTAGGQKRDFIYIDDCVEAFLAIIKQCQNLQKGFYEFQIGTNRAVTIKDFVLLIQKLTGNRETVLNFGALPYRENEIMDCIADTALIKSLGWSPKYSLEQGIQITIDREKNV